MPQPINTLVKDPHVILEKNALADKPAMAILVCRIFAAWASIERHLDSFLVHMVGADVAPAHAIFSILQAQHLQTKALEAAARASMNDSDFQVFFACKRIIDQVHKTRNRLAHWAWGICKQRPDLLILADPKMLKERDTRSAAYFQSLEISHNFDNHTAWEILQFDASHMLAYSQEDLTRDLRDIDEADGICSLLGIYLDPSIGLVSHPGYGEPLTSEQIREGVLHRMNERRLFVEALAAVR